MNGMNRINGMSGRLFSKITGPLVRALLLGALAVQPALSQTDSTLTLDEEAAEVKTLVSAFNSSYVVNGHSTNTLSPGRLNFFISHRFGTFDQGPFNLFGLDDSSIRFGFEYGVTSRLTVGLGRSSAGKNYDGFVKYKLLTQSHGGGAAMPVSLVWFSSTALSAVDWRSQTLNDGRYRFSDYFVYTHQALISRRFSSRLSLQLSPTLVHRNKTKTAGEAHDVYALGAGGRLRLTRKLHLTADYFYTFRHAPGVYNPAAVGIDLVTGGHVFQVYLNNAKGIIEKEFLTNTRSDAAKGQVGFGFTVMRSFVLRPEVKGGKMH
jgi:hypothetical protein